MNLIGKMIGEKRRWRQYKARTGQLPENYRVTVEAIERFLMYSGSVTDGEVMMVMLEDLADLFEESAANQTPIRGVVGEDPVAFAEMFIQNYADGQWVNKERQRLAQAIDRVADDKS